MGWIVGLAAAFFALRAVQRQIASGRRGKGGAIPSVKNTRRLSRKSVAVLSVQRQLVSVRRGKRPGPVNLSSPSIRGPETVF